MKYLIFLLLLNFSIADACVIVKTDGTYTVDKAGSIMHSESDDE